MKKFTNSALGARVKNEEVRNFILGHFQNDPKVFKTLLEVSAHLENNDYLPQQTALLARQMGKLKPQFGLRATRDVLVIFLDAYPQIRKFINSHEEKGLLPWKSKKTPLKTAISVDHHRLPGE